VGRGLPGGRLGVPHEAIYGLRLADLVVPELSFCHLERFPGPRKPFFALTKSLDSKGDRRYNFLYWRLKAVSSPL
jgi:hypothetical protein